MDILKCTHAVSVTVLPATAPVVPAAAQSANAVLQDTSRQDVGTVFFSRPRPGFCASSRSRECLRVSMPSTFMPWASEPLVRLGGLALQSGQHAPRYRGRARTCRRHAELAYSAKRLARSRTGRYGDHDR